MLASSPMPDNYFARYLPLLIHFLLAGALASALVTLSWIIGFRRPTRAKLSPYECGMTPIGDARERFSVIFSPMAMSFIVFHGEALFLYPWVIILNALNAHLLQVSVICKLVVYSGIVVG